MLRGDDRNCCRCDVVGLYWAALELNGNHVCVAGLCWAALELNGHTTLHAYVCVAGLCWAALELNGKHCMHVCVWQVCAGLHWN